MITLSGEFYLKGIGGDPVVFISATDQPRLLQWWTDNSIFTQLFYHPYPTTKISTPTIYFAKSLVGQLQEGDKVNITIDIRPESRGNGIKTLSVLYASPIRITKGL